MRTFIITAIISLSFIAFAGDDTNRFVFKNSAFSIEALDEPGENSAQVVMFLPASDGFSPNVNVIIQPGFKSIEQYVQVSDENSKKSGIDMGKAEIKDNVATFDYNGNYGGRGLHHYARAIFSGGKVWLATATALDTQWPKAKSKLKACVDSFKLER